ncbi:MAG: PEGA domain-containing protein [Planctomycetes bacterium]|nr:PEGA domain-containing protein [Planctomycetota bacterium]
MTKWKRAVQLIPPVLFLAALGCQQEKIAPKEVVYKDFDTKYLATRIVNNIGRSIDTTKLQIFPTDKVWIVNIQGGKNTDEVFQATLEDALISALTAYQKCAVVERDTDIVRNLYLEHQESKDLDIKDDTLVKTGKLLNADKILAYRIMKVEKKGFNILEKAFQTAFFMIEPSEIKRVRLALHLRVIDVASGAILASGFVEESEDNSLFYDNPYPARTVGPISSGRYQGYSGNQKVDSVTKIGRAYRTYSNLSDNLGPHGLYKNRDWDEWSRENSYKLGPDILYDATFSNILLTTTPSNARVYVDGVEVGKTPMYFSQEMGEKITVYKIGYLLEEFTVPPDRSAFHIILRPR